VGSGPPIICHPGGPGFSASYLGDLGGLGASFELILVDPRGTGATPAPDDPHAYATSDYADDLEQLRAHLGLETIDLLGHSHGGVAAIGYAAGHPRRVRRLVLASSLARFDQQELDAAMALRADEPWYEDALQANADEEAGRYSTPEELAAIVLRELPFYFAQYGPDERAYAEGLSLERPNPDALKLFNAGLGDFDLRPELAAIEASTLVITGRDDFITGPDRAEELATGIRGSELVLIEECGHFLFVERPAEFRTAVESFLGG
jgi:pimeloyl-ACP methyl ester carboxylesterase